MHTFSRTCALTHKSRLAILVNKYRSSVCLLFRLHYHAARGKVAHKPQTNTSPMKSIKELLLRIFYLHGKHYPTASGYCYHRSCRRDCIGNNSLPSFLHGLLAPLTEKVSDHAHFGKHYMSIVNFKFSELQIERENHLPFQRTRIFVSCLDISLSKMEFNFTQPANPFS